METNFYNTYIDKDGEIKKTSNFNGVSFVYKKNNPFREITKHKYFEETKQDYPIIDKVCREMPLEEGAKLYRIVYNLLEYKHKWDAILSLKCSNKQLEKELKMLIKEIQNV